MALAFGIVAFLLGFHEKHNPLDQAVHTLQVCNPTMPTIYCFSRRDLLSRGLQLGYFEILF